MGCGYYEAKVYLEIPSPVSLILAIAFRTRLLARMPQALRLAGLGFWLVGHFSPLTFSSAARAAINRFSCDQ